MKRKGRRSRRNRDGGGDGGGSGSGGGGGGDQRWIRSVAYLDGNPGNRTSASGEPIFMISIADRDGSIETIAMNVADTKKLIIDGLIALHTANQPFATYLINKYFMVDGPHPHGDWERTDE